MAEMASVLVVLLNNVSWMRTQLKSSIYRCKRWSVRCVDLRFHDICAVFPIEILFSTQICTNTSTFFKLFSSLLEIEWLKCCSFVCRVERISSHCVSVFILQIVWRVWWLSAAYGWFRTNAVFYIYFSFIHIANGELFSRFVLFFRDEMKVKFKYRKHSAFRLTRI